MPLPATVPASPGFAAVGVRKATIPTTKKTAVIMWLRDLSAYFEREEQADGYIPAIETSCDETVVAIVTRGREILEQSGGFPNRNPCPFRRCEAGNVSRQHLLVFNP